MKHEKTPSSNRPKQSSGGSPLGRGLGGLILGGVGSTHAGPLAPAQPLSPLAPIRAETSSEEAPAFAGVGPSTASVQGSSPAGQGEAGLDGVAHSVAGKVADLQESPRGLAAYQLISVHRIDPNPHQPRQEFDEASLEDLTRSIQAEGLLQPVLVRAEGDRYRLVAGERRLKAYRRLGNDRIPAHVLSESDDMAMARIALVENLQRENLNPIEAALGYHNLMENFALTQESLAEQVRKPRATVANALRLLQLAPTVREYVAQGVLTAGHAKALLGLESAALQLAVAQEIIDKDWSVRETEQRVRRVKETGSLEGASIGAPARQKLEPQRAEVLHALGQQLSLQLRTEVALREGPKGGKLVIDYQGQGELERLLKKLGLKG